MDQRTVDIIQREMRAYAKPGINGMSYFTRSDDDQVCAIVSLGFLPGKRIVNTALLVRLEDDVIVIEQDINDRPLVDTLVANGIPRDQIVLAYQGEKLPAGISPLPGAHLVQRG